MTLIVGIDEAGYGPKLGPLVVTAAVFRTEEPVTDLWAALGEAVTDSRDRSPRLLVADSKKAYDRSAAGLARLEETTLAFLTAAGKYTGSTCELLRTLGVATDEIHQECPWYANLDSPLPVQADPQTTTQRAQILTQVFAGAGIRFAGLISRVLRTKEFNAEVARTGNKARALFSACAQLIRAALAVGDETDVVIDVDRHGGRWYYEKLLAGAFPFARIRPIVETPDHSRYFMNLLDQKVQISFTVQADSLSFPVALASMASKYVRELHMRAFNAWWVSQVPGLAPTAGYAAHAAEFISNIERTIGAIGIDRLALVRQR